MSVPGAGEAHASAERPQNRAPSAALEPAVTTAPGPTIDQANLSPINSLSAFGQA